MANSTIRSDSAGPSWLTVLGHAKDSLWSVDFVSMRIGRTAHPLGSRRDGPMHGSHRGLWQSDGCFGQAVNDLLLVAGIVATGYQPGFLQARQPVGQNVRGYPLLRPGSIAI